MLNVTLLVWMTRNAHCTIVCVHLRAVPHATLCVLQLVTQEQIESARAGLSSKAAGDAEAAFEAEKARVGEERRAQLEAQLAAAAEAAAAAAAEAEVGECVWVCAVTGHTC
jgi:hypothetical protein